MSSLIFHADREQVLMATDTLATSTDGQPFKFTTKAFFIPHLRMLMAGTGLMGFLGRWFIQVNDWMLVKGIDNLNNHAPRYLSSIWQGYKEEVSAGEISATIYHCGFSEIDGLIHTYVYRAPHFLSETLGCGLVYLGGHPKPASDGHLKTGQL